MISLLIKLIIPLVWVSASFQCSQSYQHSQCLSRNADIVGKKITLSDNWYLCEFISNSLN